MRAGAASRASEWRDRADVAEKSPDAAAISRLVRRGFALRKYRPRPLPHAAMQLLAMTRSERVDFDEIARVMERDVALTAEVMRIVNSPVYSRGAPVTSVAQAVNRLGFAALREVATQAAMKVAIPPCEAYLEAFDHLHAHGVAVAHLTRAVANAAGVPGDESFLAGLFHDVGLTAALMMLADVYGEEAPAVDAVWPELERVHGTVGWRMCQLWELPTSVQRVAQLHHDDVANTTTHAVVVLSDHLATLGGAVISFDSLGAPPNALVDAAADLLGLGPEKLADLERRAETWVEDALGGME